MCKFIVSREGVESYHSQFYKVFLKIKNIYILHISLGNLHVKIFLNQSIAPCENVCLQNQIMQICVFVVQNISLQRTNSAILRESIYFFNPKAFINVFSNGGKNWSYFKAKKIKKMLSLIVKQLIHSSFVAFFPIFRLLCFLLNHM